MYHQNFTNSYENSYNNTGSSSSYGGGSSSYPYGNGSSGSGSPSHRGYTGPGQNTGSGDLMSRMNEREAISLLQHLEKEDLQHLLDDDSKLQDLINDLPQLKSIQQEHDNLIATNKSLAEYNLSLQPRIEDLKQYVAIEYELINTLKTDLAKDKTKLDGFVGHRSLDTLLALIQTETAKAEEEAEDLAEKFCSQDVDIEDFISDFLPKRTLAHMRRIKSERMAEILRDTDSHRRSMGHSSSGSGPSWGQSAAVPPYPNNGPSPPYPTSGFGMPQPNMFPR